MAKGKKIDIGKRASAARAEVAILHSLAEVENAKAAKLEKGMQIAEKAISSVGEQALQKANQIASITDEAAKWSTFVSKAQRDKVTIDKKYETLKSQLADFL